MEKIKIELSSSDDITTLGSDCVDDSIYDYKEYIQNKKRKEGYYWVKDQCGWMVSFYDGYYWNHYDNCFKDCHLDKIDERRIKRLK